MPLPLRASSIDPSTRNNVNLYPNPSSNTPHSGFTAKAEELDQFIEPSYLPQARRVAAMGRRKIEIKAIKDDRNRSVYVFPVQAQQIARIWASANLLLINSTFLKRKGGLFKKAHELSVLCSVDVAVIIFGNNKKLYEYSSSDIGEILTRYNYVRFRASDIKYASANIFIVWRRQRTQRSS